MNDHFNNAFWCPSVDPIPNYSLGLHVLHDRLMKSVQENDAITQYIQQRIHTENQCAQILAGNTNKLSMINTSLNSAFDIVCSESLEAAHCHSVRASLLSQDVLDPLINFTTSFQEQLNASKATLDSEISEFQHTAQSALLTRSVYWSKCRTLELACPDFRPPVPPGFEEQEEEDDDFIGSRHRSSSVTSELNVDTGGVRLGHCTVLPYREVARSMSRMQKMIERVKSDQPRQFLGKHVFEWVRDYMVSPPTGIMLNQGGLSLDSETKEICQHLVALKFLRSVPKETNGFGLDRYYEVQQNIVERYKRKTRIRHTEDEPEGHDRGNTVLEVPSTNGPKGVINNLFGRLKMDSTTKAHLEMKDADTAYQNKIKAVDQIRRTIEENLVDHFNAMEALEKDRIKKIKNAFITMASVLSDSLSMFKDTYNRVTLFQETLKADQDIRYIVEQYSTGPFCPKPMIYENYYHGSATNQIFGVPLEEVAQIYGSYVPPIVSKGIRLIDAGLSVTNTDESAEEVWSYLIPVKEMNMLCAKLDGLVGNQLKTALEAYDLNVLANLIRVYLLELPDCLLTFDLYDPVKLLYAQQDATNRLLSISKLLATLPSTNYHTLKALSHHLFKLLKQTTSDGLLNHLISTFSYILMRPRTSSPIHIHDRHPKRLVRDLFTHYNAIFTKDVNQAQKSGASRSAIVADNLALIMPNRQPILFDDPDSQPSTPRVSTAEDRISSELSLMLDMTEGDDAIEISDKKAVVQNRSRASTRGSMDNVVLDPFFNE